MRGVENEECGKCGVWKMRSEENEEYSPKIMYYLGSQFFSSIKRSPSLNTRRLTAKERFAKM